MKLFLNKTIFFAFILLSTIVLVNLTGDAANLFSESFELALARLLIDGHRVKNVQNLDERMLQKNIINLRSGVPDVLILGSSRGMLIGSKYSKKSLFNHCVSGCSVEDLIAIFQILKKSGQIPKKIVINADPWLFNKNNRQNCWKSIQTDFFDFWGKTSSDFFATKYLQLLSPSYFQASLLMLFKRITSQNETTPEALQENDDPGNFLIRLPDGTIQYDHKFRSANLETIKERIASYKAGPVYSLENYNSLSKYHIELFESLINHMQKSGIELEFLLVPYPETVFQVLQTRIPAVLEFENYIRRVAEERNIKLTGSFYPRLVNVEDSDFYDGMHLNEDGVEKLLKKKLF